MAKNQSKDLHDTSLLYEMFQTFNRLCFNSELPDCEIKVGRKSSDGCCRIKGNHCQIIISRRFEWTKENLETIMLHEMTHLYIGNVLKIYFDGLFGHGWVFKYFWLKFWVKYGINIFRFIKPKKSTLKLNIDIWLGKLLDFFF